MVAIDLIVQHVHSQLEEVSQTVFLLLWGGGACPLGWGMQAVVLNQVGHSLGLFWILKKVNCLHFEPSDSR